MVAITVILAAVIGTFVLGLGDQVQSQAPQTSFQFETANSSTVIVTHGGGDSIEAQELIFKSTAFSDTAWDAAGNRGPQGSITAGQSVAIGSGGNATESSPSGTTLRLIWENPNSDKSNTLAKYEVP